MTATPPDPRAEYLRRRDAHLAGLAHQERRSRALSNLRVLAFLAILAVLAAVLAHAPLHPAWLLAPIALFSALVVRHEQIERASARAQAAVDLYRRGLDRLDDRWPGGGRQGRGLAPPDHPYAADLDLFGPASLFERLAGAATPVGERTLAAWLLAPAPIASLRERHAALDDLRARLDLREDLALLVHDPQLALDPAALLAWAEAPPLLEPARARRLHLLAALLTLLCLGALALAIFSDHGALPLLACVALNALVGRRYGPFIDAASGRVAAPRRALSVLARLLARLDRERFTAPYLLDRQRLLAAPPDGAAAAIARLVRRVDWLEARQSPLFVAVEYLALWSLHWSLAIERWRRAHGPAIPAWFDALGEIEAITALAAYAYERPLDPLPELLEGPPRLLGDELVHPLLPGCIANSIDLGAPRRVLMVSGSNMSGKSTYLRTVGVNVVLALAGAPIAGRRLALTPLALGATLRVEDSLRDNASRFYAELARLRHLMDLARRGAPPLLFLLDEIFHGTNSHDRRIGAEALLRAFVDAGALGLCTTHDLALAAAIEELGERAENVHFQDELLEGRLSFDYRMRPGVVQRSNALALMRAVGLLPAEG